MIIILNPAESGSILGTSNFRHLLDRAESAFLNFSSLHIRAARSFATKKS